MTLWVAFDSKGKSRYLMAGVRKCDEMVTGSTACMLSEITVIRISMHF